MGLFSLLRKKPNQDDNLQVLYFKNGQMFKVEGKDETHWYDADIIISDGVRYDLRDIGSIRKIKPPKFELTSGLEGYGITGSLDYVLRMKAGKCFNRKEKELCSALLWKSSELMLAHDYCWRKKDFERLIDWHYDLGMISEAEKAKKWLSSKPIYTENTFDILAKDILGYVLRDSKVYGCDLVAFQDHGGGCCAKCAKYTGRVYSLSGNSKKFPRLPDYVFANGNFHPGCRCTISTYYDGDPIYHKGETVDAEKSSNRPYIDDRTDREKALYQEYVERVIKEEAEAEAKQRDRAEYQEILSVIPDSAPKSFNAYRRMKNFKTENFMKLVELLKEKGVEIQF